jgi:hypothetical protein
MGATQAVDGIEEKSATRKLGKVSHVEKIL